MKKQSKKSYVLVSIHWRGDFLQAKRVLQSLLPYDIKSHNVWDSGGSLTFEVFKTDLSVAANLFNTTCQELENESLHDFSDWYITIGN